MVVGGNDRCWTSYFHSLDVVTTFSISAALRRCCRNPSRGRHHLMYLRSLGTRTINKLNRAEELGSAAPATFPTFRKCLIVSMAGAPRATQRESSSTTSHLTGDASFWRWRGGSHSVISVQRTPEARPAIQSEIALNTSPNALVCA